MAKVLEPSDSVKISAYLGHDKDDVIANLVKGGMPSDKARALVHREYRERARIDAEDDALDGD